MAGAAHGAQQPDDPAWQAYKRRFVAVDGRVVDTGNRRVAHSESQGFGMILAEAYGDRETFDRIRAWTARHLGWERGGLHSWRWQPDQPVASPDRNNATDGDLLIGWALDRAARRWGEPAYAEAARAIARDVRLLLVAAAGGRTVLLPGATGFESPAGTTVNLSYYVFPALDAFARLDPSPVWARLERDGLALIEDARFGRWGLPPDWLTIAPDGRIAPARDHPPRFGYDAVRIPLYLVWAGFGTPGRLEPFRAFWAGLRAGRPAPGWTSLADGRPAPYAASPGQEAVARLVLARTDQQPGPAAGLEGDADDDYYSASLRLLASLAARETGSSGRG